MTSGNFAGKIASAPSVNSPKNYLIVLLAATTLGGAILAWRQHRDLGELRAAAMNRGERADLQKRLWELEKSNRDLQARLKAQRGAGEPEDAAATTPPGDRPGRDRGRGGDPRGRGESGMQQAIAMRELMNKPEVQAMINLQQKAAIDARYAPLFKNLNLAPEQIERLKTLLAERATTVQDVMGAAREQGINPRENPDAVRKLVTDAQNEVNNSIKSALGEQGFAQLSNYEQTLPQRSLVNELQQRLSYTSTPLTSAQAEQMVQILATNPPARTSGPTDSNNEPMHGPPGGRGGPPPGDFIVRGPDIGGMIAGVFGGGPGMGMIVNAFDGGRGGSVTVTNATVAQAQTVLSPPQVGALQQIQQQQQAQQQLRQMVHDTLSPNPSADAPTGSSPAPRPRGGGG